MSSGPNLEFELSLGFPAKLVAGVDEVGRGCIAGPVVACAVILRDWREISKSSVREFENDVMAQWSQDSPWINRVNDSKKLNSKVRDELAERIKEWVCGYAIGEANVEEIDSINILHASHLAMRRALDGLGDIGKEACVLVDGKFSPNFSPIVQSMSGGPKSYHPLIKGDQKSLTVACASILAKVHRDHWMKAQAEKYLGYGFEKHKGYLTQIHLEALRKYGPTPLHRKSFEPVASMNQ